MTVLPRPYDVLDRTDQEQGRRVSVSIEDRLGLMNEAFQPSAPIHTKELLAGRQEQLFDLLEMSQTAGAHAAIFGERGVGKTSVAAVFEDNLKQRGRRAIRINCSVADTFQSLWQSMFDEWISSATDEGEVQLLSGVIGTHLSQAAIVRVLDRLSQESHVVVIFDEFDVLGDDSVGEDFANLMKAMSDKRLRAHIAVVGVAEDVNAILAGHRSVGRGLHQIKMPRLKPAELDTILVNGFKTLDMTYPPELAARVVRLSQRLPHYTHLLGKELARRAILGERSHVEMEDWDQALISTLAKAEQQVIDLYADATTTAKKSMFPELLLACALATKDQQGFMRPVDVGTALNEITGTKYAMAAYTGNLAKLALDERGPALQVRVFADNRKRYRFANPLLQPYVLLKAVSEDRVPMERIRDDAIWGEA